MDASMTYASRSIARRIVVLAAAVTVTLSLTGCAKLKARDLLNKGVKAFTAGQSDIAIENFKRAKELDPKLLVARLYLATAYASLYIPGAPSAENKARGEQAIAEFKDVLELDANNLNAIDGIGSLLYNMAGTPPVNPKGFDEAKTYQQRHIQIKPDDPEPYYWIGVINWTVAYADNGMMRRDYNTKNTKKQIKEDDPLPAALRADYVNKDGALVDEGISNLQKAISIKPDYDDAMTYLNLLYRRKADMVESADERASLQKQADDLLDKVKEIKQKRVEQQSQQSS
jgi:tetratricopeptide (TPR) repeat protein